MALGLGLVIADDAVPQDRRGDRANVFDVGTELAVQRRVHFGAHDEVLRGARPGAPRQVRIDIGGGALPPGARLPHETDRVLQHVVGDGHPADELLEVLDFGTGDDRLHVRHRIGRRGLHDAQLLRVRRIIDPRVEHETVELGFRQRVRAFLFDRVLGREDEEGRRQRVVLAGHRHGALLHRFEQGGLRFGRRSVDLVCQHDVRKNRPLHEFELARLVEDLGADDVGGHQVGRELDAVEAEAERPRDGVDEEGFGQTRHTDQQHVAASKDRRGNFPDDVVLAYDDLPDFREQRPVFPIERFQRVLIRSVHEV